MYPTMVIILVETQRSMMDVCEISPSNTSKFPGRVARPAILGHLSPLPSGQSIHSTMDVEAGPLRSRALQSQGGQEYGLLGELILEVKESHIDTSA